MRAEDDQSPDAIEEQIEETRHQLSDTLEELQRRLSPRDVFDEAMSYLRSNEGMGRNLSGAVRENPVPYGLIGLGVTWLIASSASGGSHRRSGEIHSGPMYGSGATASGSSGEPQTKHKARQTMSDARSKASEAAGSAKDKLQDAKANLSSKAESTKERISSTSGQGHTGGHMKERYENARYKGSEMARNMRDGYQQRTYQVRHQANSLIEERPLAVVAIGFGIGAALGLMLPSTHRENQWMGGIRDDLKERALEEGHEQFERARETVESAAEAAREKAEHSTSGASQEESRPSRGAGTSAAGIGAASTTGSPAGTTGAAGTQQSAQATSPTQSPGTEPRGDGKGKNQAPGKQP